jgi:LmbE family N-acetylglucosaminyl deacetylase
MNPYRQFVSDFANLFAGGKQLPLGNFAPAPKIQLAADAPVALIFSPHPDDECIIGGLALRLLREAGMRIVNVPVTHGSNQERQQPRLHELKNACDYLGFELEQTAPNGLEKINLRLRAQDPQHWETAVRVIAASLAKNKPRVIFFPHELDWNATHIGTHWLVMDALKTLPVDFQTSLIETEFWGQMASPNLMVELGANEVADLMAGLSCHIGEVRRNPYHLRMLAWLQDNVRRGAELVGGQGGVAPDFLFATLYRARKWQDGQVKEFFSGGRQLSVKLSVKDSPGFFT